MSGKSKSISIAVLVITQIGVMSLWFSSAAVLAEMGAEAGLSSARLAWLSTSVQIGFGIGAFVYALLGLSDRYDPRRVFALSAIAGAIANLGLLVVPLGGVEAIILRGLTGAAMAGVYPVGMKIAVGWGKADRALLVGTLVCALTIGSASPYLIALFGGTDWRVTIWVTTLIALASGVGGLTMGLGPYHASAARLDLGAITLAWSNRRVRLAILGYIGHMWELYAFWTWVGVIASTSFAVAGVADGASLAKITAFVAIALGGLACVPAGRWGDRFGSDLVALICLVGSGGSALAAALLFGGPAWLMIGVLIVWGILIIPDSAQYSTLVADAAPAERAGSILTIQNAAGFLLTAVTVQAMPALASVTGWPIVLAIMAIGPLGGVVAMALYRREVARG
ncbi:MFS transporter [Rhodobacteraceae bacterium NNCM2]|nr:MFS transporter [Coraliihabitans acroporae]